MEGAHWLDTRYEEELQEKGAQHKAMEELLKDYGCNVTTLSINVGDSGSHYHTTCYAPAKIGIEYRPASDMTSRFEEHSVLTFHEML